MATLQKTYESEANATGMSTAKNQQNSLKFRKTARCAKCNKKLINYDTDVRDQTCILNHLKYFYETLF